MIRKLIIGLVVLGTALSGTARANNVRIEGEVKVTEAEIDRQTNIATVSVQLKWDNSWRDAFNYDAVYLFLKYKVDGLNEVWHHAYLEGTGHQLDRGFSYLMSNSNADVAGMQNHCEGIFIYRSDRGTGNVSLTDLKLKWNIKSNSERVLDRDLFTSGSVFLSAMAIEMVYIPRGAFRAGDTYSTRTFANGDVLFPEDRNILIPENVQEMNSEPDLLASNPPEFIMNRINDVTKDASNAWIGTSGTIIDESKNFVSILEIRFKDAVTIRSFAIESVEGHTPEEWALEVHNKEGRWVSIYPKYNLPYDQKDNQQPNTYASGDAWAVNSRETYPCTRTLRADWGGSDVERFSSQYRIRIFSSSAEPYIKNMAMSEADILAEVDNSVLVYDSISKMNQRFGLCDGDVADESEYAAWTGNTDVNYPNGYKAFFTMKYEVSQEEYVAFLNKLTAPQQRARTIGSNLAALKEGMYVFGGVGTRAVARNGIKLASIGLNDAPYVFANDLNPRNDYAQDGDGQTVACNFLNAGDMRAYADWCGLRPLTEMEYEKMARRPFPEASLRGEFAWNTTANFSPATKFDGITAGTSRETMSGGNVNARNLMKGPVRCGAFANLSGSDQVAAGASFWGVMELSGNLSELYYNANSAGRLFRGERHNQHGDGAIGAEGKTNMSAEIWTESPWAFALRGGSFVDDSMRMFISDRERNKNVYTSVDQVNEKKDSTVTFRLGRTAPVLHKVSEVSIAGGQTSSVAVQDLVCSGADYTISGSVPGDIEGAYRIAWFKSSDGGSNWDLMEGETSPSLTLTDMRNENSAEDVFKDYWFKRYIYTNGADYVQSNPIKIRVINQTLKLSSAVDTVDVWNYSKGIRITAPQESEFQWTWLRENDTKPVTVEYVLRPQKEELHFFAYKDFLDGTMFDSRVNKILLETTVMERCKHEDTLKIYVRQKPSVKSGYNEATGGAAADFHCGEVFQDNETGVGSNKEYRTVRIGNRCWFADNLNRTTKTGEGDSKCYEDNDANCEKYGRLYNWMGATRSTTSQYNTGEEVRGICPAGWHLPSNREWIQLFADMGVTVDADNSVVDGRGLKSVLNDWEGQSAQESHIGNDTTRFDAQPGGMRSFMYYPGYDDRWNTEAGIKGRSGFHDRGTRGWWWTSTNSGTRSCYWHSNSWTLQYMPYYVRMDEDGKMYFNIETGSYYVTNTIFHSRDHYYMYSSNSDSNTALSSMRNEFYFSVRCIRDGVEH